MSDRPNISFKGFSDAWEQRKLGESLAFLKDGTHGTHADADDGPLLLSAKNIKDGTIKWDETDRRISLEEYEKIHSNFSLKTGDILLTIMGSIGETAILKDPNGLTFQRSVAFLRPKEDILSNFLYTEIQNPTFQKELDSRKSTSAQPGIYLGDLAEIPVRYSPSLDEQSKIGEYFLNLDNLITLHQRKYDEMSTIKKTMLQKLFPKKGKNVPEIRFEGFNEEWRRKKLGELYKERNERGNDSLDFLLVSIHTGVTSGELDGENTGRNVKRSDDKSTYKHVYEGDLVFNMMRAWQGAIGVAKSEGMVSPAYISAIPNDKVYPLFMDYALRRDSVISDINNMSYGITDFRKRLYWDSFANVECLIPSVGEQKKIYDFFYKIDMSLSLHQKRYKELTAIKKYMLQNMFV